MMQLSLFGIPKKETQKGRKARIESEKCREIEAQARQTYERAKSEAWFHLSDAGIGAACLCDEVLRRCEALQLKHAVEAMRRFSLWMNWQPCQN